MPSGPILAFHLLATSAGHVKPNSHMNNSEKRLSSFYIKAPDFVQGLMLVTDALCVDVKIDVATIAWRTLE
jgi:hypothetical protein